MAISPPSPGRHSARFVLEHGLEATLQRDRRVVLGSLALVVALAWLYLWRDAASMSHMGMADMPMSSIPGTSSGWQFALTFAMWTVMMVGMMLPSAAPTILLYGTLVRRNGERGTVLPSVWIFTSGYLAVWTAFSLLATLLQVALEDLSLLSSMMASASPRMSAAILIAAGIYQWLPFKEACLRQCRNPLRFFVARWRSGASGAFRMGVESGAYCVGCCGVLMLLLFVAGVMNLLWVALIAGFVLVEKLLPAGRSSATFAGVALTLAGVALLLRP
jgi:predicted metal-binding membrane protein